MKCFCGGIEMGQIPVLDKEGVVHKADDACLVVGGNPEPDPNGVGANADQVGGKHYKLKKIQPWDYIVANNIPFLEGCAIKHLSRHREKGGREDMEKAIHYIEKAIEVYYGKR
jgi:hypothetical protein